MSQGLDEERVRELTRRLADALCCSQGLTLGDTENLEAVVEAAEDCMGHCHGGVCESGECDCDLM